MLETQSPGNVDATRVTHRFGDRTIDLDIERADGVTAKLQGRMQD